MITQARLKELLDYDPSTGVFTRRVSRGPVAAGAVAGSKQRDGYLRINIDRKWRACHRLAWLYVTGMWPAEEIDHKNCDKLDNRFSNLREASHAENMHNFSTPKNNTSGYKGVSFHLCGKWRARISVNGASTSLGYFDRLEDAAAAYAEASKRLHKEFGRAA